MPKIRRKSIENDFLLIFFCMQSEGVAQSSILMILRHPLFLSNLYGGAKQETHLCMPLKPAIARENGDGLLFIDKATASVDPENEHLIQGALSELTWGKTVITIAHLLATMENADYILVVEDGKIVQTGTHSELIKEDGLYRRFVEVRQKDCQ